LIQDRCFALSSSRDPRIIIVNQAHTHTHSIVTATLGLRLTSERKLSKGCEDLSWFLVWVHAIAEGQL
jgi:hypothetical protein